MHDRLGIRTRTIDVASGFEFTPQVGVVVDFAVERDPDRPVLVGEGLFAGGEIDNAQAPVTEHRVGMLIQSRVVRAAMGEDIAHRRHAACVVGRQRFRCNYSGYSTHPRDPDYAATRARSHVRASFSGMCRSDRARACQQNRTWLRTPPGWQRGRQTTSPRCGRGARAAPDRDVRIRRPYGRNRAVLGPSPAPLARACVPTSAGRPAR